MNRNEDGSYSETNWVGGIDNRSRAGRVREGCVRDAINLVPTHDGRLTARPGRRRIYAGTAVRGAVAVDGVLLVADGDKLVEVDTRDDTTRELATIAAAGAFAGAVLNGEAFITTETEVLRYRDGVLRRWGVPDANAFALSVVPGNARAGRYFVACTLVNAYGEEGGVLAPAFLDMPVGRALRVTPPAPPAGHRVRLYVSPANSETLYLQADNFSAPVEITTPRDDTARLTTLGDTAPTPGHAVVAVGGTLAVAAGREVWLTNPLQPHLRRRDRYFAYGKPVGILLACGAGLYVSADKTYFIGDVDGTPVQHEVLPYPGVSGTGTELGDGRVAWMTPYGIAAGNAEGGVELISRDRFAPEVGAVGASGLVDCNGTQSIITTLRNTARNPLAARDYMSMEFNP